ncbi:prenylated Rab acceptor protein 1 [Hydra vulgaris]|uniref:PRA1 family protein n=1 Tax=Hydra vulgaris TaxID=6087 RepID=A0ABM4B712_HYDVU
MTNNLENITGQIDNEISSKFLNEIDKTKLQLIKGWFIERSSQLQPWKSFCNINKFSKPKNAGEVSKRLFTNIKIYQGNYIAVSAMLILYCILTSPLLLFGLVMSFGGCYYISTRGQGKSIKLLGRDLTMAEQYGLVFLISLPLFFLASAGSIVFWIIGASAFIIVLHASMLELKSVDLELQEVNIL